MQFTIPANSANPATTMAARLHGLDTLRGLAAVLVVLLHAGIPYMVKPIPYLVWPARDIHPSLAVDAMTWCTECFLMPLFFVLAGFFSQGLLVSRGERTFLEGRTKRLLWTQIAAGVSILPICLGIWSLGWVADGLYVPQDIMNTGLPEELAAELYGVGHLWFMQNLYIYCLILCGVSWLAKRVQVPRPVAMDGSHSPMGGVDRMLACIWKPVIPAIPCALVLFWDLRIVLGFYQAYIPILSKLLYYSIYFFLGATICRHRATLHLHARYSRTYLLMSGLLFVPILPMIHEHLTQPLTGGRRALLAGLMALFACVTTFGLLAAFLRFRIGDNKATRYLAEASFWVYLVHLPFVALSHIGVAQLPIPTVGKFVLAGSAAMALSLLTFQAFVRHTWLGEFLNGRRRTGKPEPLAANSESPKPVLARAA